MNKKNNFRHPLCIVSIFIVALISISCILLWGFHNQNTQQNKKQITQKNSIQEPKSSKKQSAEPKESSSSKTTSASDTDWSVAKSSGSQVAFEKYFNPVIDEYTTKKKGVALGKIKKITYHSTIIKEKREAYVYTPPGYQKNKTYPVLYLIHGIGASGEQWVSMQLNEIISNMIANKEVIPFIAVCPSVVPPVGKKTNEAISPENITAFAKFNKEFTTDLQPYIQKHFPISQKRKDTAICGLSMGGMKALDLGFRHLETFNYIGSFSAAPTLDTSLLKVENKKNTPALVMLSNGTADATVKDIPKDYHNILTRNKVEHIWFQYPDEGHNGTVWINSLINFLKRIYR